MVIGYAVFNLVLAVLVVSGFTWLVVTAYRELSPRAGIRPARRAAAPRPARQAALPARGRPRPEA